MSASALIVISGGLLSGLFSASGPVIGWFNYGGWSILRALVEAEVG